MTNHVFKPINIHELNATFENEVTNKDDSGWKIVSSQEKTVGYKLKQSVEVRSSEVDRIEQLGQRIQLRWSSRVFYSRPGDTKLFTRQAAETKSRCSPRPQRMRGTRAEQIAGQGGAPASRDCMMPTWACSRLRLCTAVTPAVKG